MAYRVLTVSRGEIVLSDGERTVRVPPSRIRSRDDDGDRYCRTRPVARAVRSRRAREGLARLAEIQRRDVDAA